MPVAQHEPCQKQKIFEFQMNGREGSGGSRDRPQPAAPESGKIRQAGAAGVVRFRTGGYPFPDGFRTAARGPTCKSPGAGEGVGAPERFLEKLVEAL